MPLCLLDLRWKMCEGCPHVFAEIENDLEISP